MWGKYLIIFATLILLPPLVCGLKVFFFFFVGKPSLHANLALRYQNPERRSHVCSSHAVQYLLN